MKLVTKFGKRLKELRKLKGLSQLQLAEAVDMETQNISRLESGDYLPKKENLEKLCVALNVEAKDLFDFGYMKPRKTLVSELCKIIKESNTQELEFYYRLISFYKESLNK